MLGNVVAQIIVLLASPILTRIYSPEEFGLLAVFTSTVAIIGTIVCGRYDAAVALPETHSETVALISAAMILTTIVAPLTSLLFITTPWAIHFVNKGYSPAFIFISVSLGSALAGVYSLYWYWGIKQEQHTLVASSRILQSVTRLATQFSFFFGGTTTLILSTIAAPLAGFFILHRGIRKPLRTSRSEISFALKRYRRFPLYTTWSAALNMSGKQLPIFAFVAIFGAGPAGLYSLAERIIAGPVSMIASAVSAMFLTESVKSKKDNTLPALVSRTHNLLTNLSIAPFLMLATTAPILFGVFFGKEWTSTGQIASWISLYLYFSFVAAPFTMLFRTLERQDAELKIQSTLFISRLIAIFLGAKIGGFIFSVACYSIVSSIYYIYVLAWASKSINLEFAVLIRQTYHSLGWGLLTTFPCTLHLFSSSTVASILIGILLSSIFTAARLIALRRTILIP